LEQSGPVWYNSLQANVKQQVTHGLTFNANYTFGHAIDVGSGWHSSTTTANGSAGGDGYLTDVTRPGLDRGNSTFDIRQRLTFNYVYEFPWMKDQKGFVGHALGGWQYQGSGRFRQAPTLPHTAPRERMRLHKDGTRNDRPDAAVNHFDASRAQWMKGWFRAALLPLRAGSVRQVRAVSSPRHARPVMVTWGGTRLSDPVTGIPTSLCSRTSS